MLLTGKSRSNIFTVFVIVVLVRCARTVTVNINYNAIRHDDEPFGLQPEQARTTRQMLETFDNWAGNRPNYTLQQATEHLLQYGALLRIQILDTFGALVYDHYDDYSMKQTEALYRVYRETLERKYNIFDIVPSVLARPDTRPTRICRHINKHVHTCLRESSITCLTIKKHDDPHPDTALSPVANITRRMFKTAKIRKNYPDGFSLPAILRHLKTGTLDITVDLLSGLLHNVQYDSFDDEVRTAERNAMILLRSDKLQNVVPKDLVTRVHTVSELLKELFDVWKKTHDKKANKSFAVLSEHVVREVEAISRNIEVLGTVYENNTIDMKYLLDLVLPTDVVDRDITEAKDYLLEKISDYDIVRKYLKVEKYHQSGPDQLLMEILGQMRDINFAVDLATALHAHARFWHQSRMINNLDELLELFDAYENLRNVPKYVRLMSLMDKIRLSLWDSKIVNIEILCNNPRACLHIGLETVVQCVLLDSETKHNVNELFVSLTQTGSIYVEKCNEPLIVPTVIELPQTGQSPITTSEQPLTDLTTEILTTTQLFLDKTTVANFTMPILMRKVDTTKEMVDEPTTAKKILTVSLSSQKSTTELIAEAESQTETPELTTEIPTTEIPLSSEMTTESTTTLPVPGSTTTGEATISTTTTKGYEEELTTSFERGSVSFNDCDGDCSTEVTNESTVTLPSGVRNTEQTQSPSTLSLSEPMKATMEKLVSMSKKPVAYGRIPFVGDCSVDNCTSTPSLEKKDCELDESCSSSSVNGDTCGHHNCESTTRDERTSDDCSGDDCKTQKSQDDSDDPQTDESTCTGDDCPGSDENRPSTTASVVLCENRDPRHQRKLLRLQKVRMINALHATTPVPEVSKSRSSSDELLSNWKSPRRLKSKLGVELPEHVVPWYPVAKRPIRDKKSMKKSGVNQTGKTWKKSKSNINRNTNVNLMKVRRYVGGKFPDPSTTSASLSYGVNPSSHRRQGVVTRIKKDKWTGGSSEKTYDVSRRQTVSSKRGDSSVDEKTSQDKIELVRKNRSIIRAPQKSNRRYRAL